MRVQVLVVRTGTQDLAHEEAEDRVIGPGPGLQVARRQAGRLGPAGIDDPQLHGAVNSRSLTIGLGMSNVCPWETTGFDPTMMSNRFSSRSGLASNPGMPLTSSDTTIVEMTSTDVSL